MPLESDNVDIATSPYWPYAVDLVIQDKLSLQSRDRILQLVIQTVGSRVSIPLFPTAEFLDVLIKNGIAKKIETDAWIHPHAFCSQTTRTELLVALVASGCTCAAITSIGNTGGMLQEIVRVALNNLVCPRREAPSTCTRADHNRWKLTTASFEICSIFKLT